ncbi:MAG: gamma-glutamylcyclotransferase [Desulfomonilaceae bacterium]
MNNHTISVFVYGTLLRGMDRSSEMEGSAYKGPALISARLYNLGAYPGIQEGDALVVGELYEVNESALSRLDRIEGYDTESPESSLFVRRTVKATDFSSGSTVEAFAYFYPDAEEEGTFIEHGDYRRYILEQGAGEQWIVAYGSNIGAARLSARVGEPLGCEKGLLEGFQLVFNKKASGKADVYANIKYVGKGSCPAVAWKLSTAQIKTLDRFEGVPSHYLRIAVPFVSQKGTLLSRGYISHPSVLTSGGSPTGAYVGYIRNGYREQGFDEGYLIRAIEGRELQ